MVDQTADLSVTGVLTDEFILEVADSRERKRGQVMFALLVDGLPGDPDFGVGLRDLLSELNTTNLRSFTQRRLDRTIPDLTTGVSLVAAVFEQRKAEQIFLVDIQLKDTESREQFLVPLALRS